MWQRVWPARRRLIIELFVIANLAFLALDVTLAHAVNLFRAPAEWLPVIFSIAAPILLAWEHYHKRTSDSRSRPVGLAIGWGAIVLGFAGMIFHLGSQFFEFYTLRSLIYAAPFVAPLAYSGLGFLLLLNRMVPDESIEWSQWVLLLGLGGFVGIFVLALADHAQNGFFYTVEWVPVVASAYGLGFLLMAFFRPPTAAFLNICLGVLALQALIGGAGVILHLEAALAGTSHGWLQKIIEGPPLMAPLLFPNLALLSGLGILDWRGKLQSHHSRG